MRVIYLIKGLMLKKIGELFMDWKKFFGYDLKIEPFCIFMLLLQVEIIIVMPTY